MSNTAIGRAALVLSTDGSELRSGLQNEASHIKSWADTTGRNVSKSLSTGAKAAGKGGGLFDFAAMLPKGAGPLAVAGMAVVGAKAGKELFSAAAETIGDLGKQNDIAKALGLSATQFTGIAGVAKSVGEDTREFVESLVTMGKLGTDAARGTEEASLAFQGLGLNANEFIKLRADEQFFKIFDALGKVSDPLQRTRLLMQAFGEDGGKFLLPLLSKTPEEIRKMAGSLAVSNEKMQKAVAANQELTKATAVLNKAWQDIAIALAPAVGQIASHIAGLKPVFDLVASAATFVGDKISGAFRSANQVLDFFDGKADSHGRKFNTSMQVTVPLSKQVAKGVGAAAKQQANQLELARDKAQAAVDDMKSLTTTVANWGNPALLAGTQAEISARMKHEFGGDTGPKQLLKAQKEANDHLKEIEKEIKEENKKKHGPPINLKPI